MADTAVPAPTWLQALQVPSLGQSVLVIVTALATVISTLGVQWLSAPKLVIPAADRPAMAAQINAAVNRIDGRLTEILGVCGLSVDEVQALRTDFKTPRAAYKPKAAVVK